MHFLRTLSLALFAILIFTSEKCEKDNYQYNETTESGNTYNCLFRTMPGIYHEDKWYGRSQL